MALVAVALIHSDRPSIAQADPWHGGQIGIQWALSLGNEEYGCGDRWLAIMDDPSSSELLLAAGECSFLAVDPRTATVLWRRELAGQAPLPLLGDRTVHFGDMAFDVTTGTSLWQNPAVEPGPMALAGDVLYVVGRQKTRMVDAERGTMLWQTPTIHQGTPYPIDGALYVIGEKGTWAIDAHSGGQVWHSPLDREGTRPWLCCAPPASFGEALVVNEVYGSVRALDVRTGKPRWQASWLVGHDVEAGVAYVWRDEPGRTVELDAREPLQMLALDVLDGQERWAYPAVDAAGTYAAPRLITWGVEPLIQGRTVYALDLAGRIVALDTRDGTPRWASEPVIDVEIWRGNHFQRTNQTLIIGSDVDSSPLVGLDASTGQVLWRREDLAGYLTAVVDSDVLFLYGAGQSWRLGEQDGGAKCSYISSWHLVHAETGRTLADLWGPTITQSHFAEGSGDVAYALRDGVLYAIGPAAPDQAIAMASTFLARGDYRSAARTLAALKVTDDPGYVANDGPAVADEALNLWLGEVDALASADKWDEVYDSISSQDLRGEIDCLQTRDAQAHLLYLRAYREIEGDAGSRPNANHYLRELRREFGDTVWAERLDALLASRQKLTLRRMHVAEPPYLGLWYVPLVPPLIALLFGVTANRKRLDLYRLGVTVGLSCLGGLAYLFWVGDLLLWRGFTSTVLMAFLPESPPAPFQCAFDVALISSVPLATWLLTRSKGYMLAALAMSAIQLVLLRVSLASLLPSWF
jgi:outer membrane protein assembly factor BamB